MKHNIVFTITSASRLHLIMWLNIPQVEMKHVEGDDVLIETSPVDPIVIVFGEVNQKYGMVLLEKTDDGFSPGTVVALTHQIVSRIVFSPTGREVMAAAMSAGHIFIYKVGFSFLRLQNFHGLC